MVREHSGSTRYCCPTRCSCKKLRVNMLYARRRTQVPCRPGLTSYLTRTVKCFDDRHLRPLDPYFPLEYRHVTLTTTGRHADRRNPEPASPEGAPTARSHTPQDTYREWPDQRMSTPRTAGTNAAPLTNAYARRASPARKDGAACAASAAPNARRPSRSRMTGPTNSDAPATATETTGRGNRSMITAIASRGSANNERPAPPSVPPRGATAARGPPTAPSAPLTSLPAVHTQYSCFTRAPVLR